MYFLLLAFFVNTIFIYANIDNKDSSIIDEYITGNRSSIIDFPFNEYLGNNKIESLDKVHRDGKKLKNNGFNDTLFYNLLFSKYFENHKNDMRVTNLLELEKLAEEAKVIYDSDSISGSFFKLLNQAALDELASKLQDIYIETPSKFKDEAFTKLRKGLESKGYRFHIPVSNYKKLVFYIKKGEFSYIFRKLLTTYRLEFFLTLGIAFVLSFFLFYYYKIYKRRASLCVTVSSILLIAFSSQVLEINSSENEPSITDFKTSELFNGQSSFWNLKKNQHDYGTAIWINDSTFKAKYFIFNNPYERHSIWEKETNNKTLALCSGNYAAGLDIKKSEGMTFEKGRAINRILRKDMDGLVVISSNGHMKIYDLKNELVDVDGDEVDINNPLFRQSFIDWVEFEEVSVFQTHLTVSNNKVLRKHSQRNNGAKAKRRLFASVRLDGEKYKVLINIPGTISLMEASEDIRNYISNHKKGQLDKLINLDTGFYDMLEIKNSNGQKLSNLKGTRPINEAVNLLCIYTRSPH